MTSFARRLLATLVASFAFALPASATNYSIDYTDLWWNSTESGWGVNVIQQYDTLFATLYVYGADNTPRWYVASGLTPSGTGVFTGTLYQTTGPAFSGAWNPSAVSNTSVGTMTFSFNSPVTGTLTYSVNGTSVTKQITRYTFKSNNLTGNYLGGMTAIATGCTNSGLNGPALIWGTLIVTQTGDTVALRVDTLLNLAATCIFTGTLQHLGRIGTISGGAMSCSAQGTSPFFQGTFTMTQIDGGINGLSSVFSASDQTCNYTGRFGGLKDVI